MLSLLFLLSYSHMHQVDISSFTTKLTRCPTFTTSIEPISSRADCVCIAGHTVVDTHCLPCPSNSFKVEPGNHSCLACPENSISWPGATSQAQCLCEKGYYSRSGLCHPCMPNSFKNFVANAPCLACPAQSISEAYSTSSSACLCGPGFERTLQGNCSACVPGKFDNKASHDPCEVCDFNTYAANFEQTACVACPEHAITNQQGSTSQYHCLCTAGYQYETFPDYPDRPPECNECQANFYCPGQSIRTSCPLHAVSLPGSTKVEDCVCKAGFYDNQATGGIAGGIACQSCPPGSYCPFNVSRPIPCKSNSFSEPRSQSEDDCICIAGFDVGI